jgi:hypothetical protein
MTVPFAMTHRVVSSEGWRRHPRHHRKRGGYQRYLIEEHAIPLLFDANSKYA